MDKGINHFVALISRPSQAKPGDATFKVDSPSHEIPDFSCHSPKHDQDFPDLSSSLEDVQSCKRQKTSYIPLQRNSTPVTRVKPSSPQSTILSSHKQRPNNDNKIQEDNKILTDSAENDSISAIHGPSEGSLEIMEDEHNHSEETSSQSRLQNKDDSESSGQDHIPEGGFELSERGLSAKEMYAHITKCDVLPKVPNGIKSNCFNYMEP